MILRCPDSGTCHHDCGAAPRPVCWRVAYAEPLSVAGYPGDEWPADLDPFPSRDPDEVLPRRVPGEQPEAQLAVDLVRAEAAIARARAVYAPHLDTLTVDGRRPERASECVCVGCQIIRALDGTG